MKKQNSKITDILALLVFAVFALCTLLVLLTGAGGYQRLTDRAAEQFDRYTAARYITTRVHQAETVAAEEFNGLPALVIRETERETDYCIYIYCYEGSVRELYCAASAKLRPEDGEVILPAESLEFTLEGQLLTVDLGEDRLFLHIPAGTEVGS